MKTAIAITKAEIQKIYKPIDSHTHKGIQGHAALVAGSYGKIGAAVLASKACIKSGCGLVTAYIPKCGYEIIQSTIPEVMVVTVIHEKYISEIILEIEAQAIGIGPGIGQEDITQKAFYEFLKTNQTPLVIDADALNILSQNKTWLNLLQPGTILTPHPKELERLIGSWNSNQEKFEKTIEFSKQYGVIVVMKGAPTHIVNEDDIYQNATGNAALATAGSGDVLTGIITSLLAQGYQPIQAAQLGVYVHGLTADIALPETGYQSFIASDIIANLGKAFLLLER